MYLNNFIALYIIFFAVATANNFGIDTKQNFNACQNVTEEKILFIKKKKIMENFNQCMKHINVHEKHQHHIETIRNKIESFPENQAYIKMLTLGNLFICVGTFIFYAKMIFDTFTKTNNNIDNYDALKLNLVWVSILSNEFRDRQTNRMETHEIECKKAIAKDIIDIINDS